MLIFIKKRIFTEDPTRRFSRVFGCPPDTWQKIWKRYKILDYSEDEAYEYLVYLLRNDIRRERFNRWLKRTEVYIKAQVAIEKGAENVQSEYFGKHKEFVEREVTKNE